MSGSNPPSRFVDVSTALSTLGRVSVIGVVVDVFGGIFKSRGSSSCITFTIKDSGLDNGHTWDGLKIKYFKDNENALPPVQLRDVILVRDLMVVKRYGNQMGVASDDNDIPWAIFRSDPDPMSSSAPLCGPSPFEPTSSERVHALNLLNSVASIDGFRKAATEHIISSHGSFVQAAIPNSKPFTHRRLTLIQDVEERTFVDLVGEIVKIYTNDSEKVLLYLTDYTTNESLENHQVDDGGDNDFGDVYGYQKRSKKNWPGPVGRMTLPVTLWEPHASYARQYLKPDNVIHLYNVHIKRSRIDGMVEASIHTNRPNANKINVRTVDGQKGEGVEQFFQRKMEYWKANPRKRKQGKESEPQQALKKPNKKQRKKAERMEEGQVRISHATNKRYAPNEQIQAGNPSVPVQSLETILSNKFHDNVSYDNVEYRLPFQNFCYRTTVRVVDFFPPKLEDFAVPRYGNSDSDDETGTNNSTGFVRWEWRFCLLVESVPPPPAGQEKERVRVFVAGPEAEHLLGIDAVDLRRNSTQLANLREKLFLLWGDLEERKRDALHGGEKSIHESGPVSSRPFNCCLREYGVICRHRPDARDANGDSDCSDDNCFGWERRFSMFMTTIRD
ncbi:telomere-binding alpha subunit central domain protein [Aspergillus ellipticus CBS 707.79]|uniref:Protection of telomeres protein 1 n=1 Tax=Aspergillus ellipticus CBS 707.79 TaxID=1448320 RepID=A0A319D387_9EURO|nr:telomere-binding alpha subunit central domain protein [Aspergillus ellipticus CBS 707.79]